MCNNNTEVYNIKKRIYEQVQHLRNKYVRVCKISEQTI